MTFFLELIICSFMILFFFIGFSMYYIRKLIYRKSMAGNRTGYKQNYKAEYRENPIVHQKCHTTRRRDYKYFKSPRSQTTRNRSYTPATGFIFDEGGFDSGNTCGGSGCNIG